MKLEWNIESDHRKDEKPHGENPNTQRQRNRRVWRISLMILAVFMLVGVVVAFIIQRVTQVDERLKQSLVISAQSEIAALNGGNRTSFMGMQRSATPDWINTQSATFDRYQADLLLTDQLYTGEVVTSAVDGKRGRVQVARIQDGIASLDTWFYWLYDEIRDSAGIVLEDGGWHHVAPDYTFWGLPQAIMQERYVVRYQALDAPFAAAVDVLIAQWFQATCVTLDCSILPLVTIDIVSDPAAVIAWNNAETPQMIVRSPYTARANRTTPLTPQVSAQIVQLLADRLTAGR